MIFDLVIYEKGSIDGQAAAFVVNQYYQNLYQSKSLHLLTILPFNSNTEIDHFSESEIENKNILILTKVTPILRKLLTKAKSFAVIGYNNTIDADLMASEVIYGPGKFNLDIIWKYFYQDLVIPKFLNLIINYNKGIYTEQILGLIIYLEKENFEPIKWATYLDNNILDLIIKEGVELLYYRSNCVENLVDTSCCYLHQINDQYQIVAYANITGFNIEAGIALEKKWPIATIACVWSFNMELKTTTHNIYLMENCNISLNAIISNVPKSLFSSNSSVTFNNMQPILTYDIIEDYGLINILMTQKKISFKINSKITFCSIINVDQMNDRWLEPKFKNLLKRLFKDSLYIAFEENNGTYSVSEDYSSVSVIKSYNLIYNKAAISDSEEKLSQSVYDMEDVINFQTDKNIIDILSKLQN